MLKDFWDKKKDLLQFLGIVTAVGAIFLVIPIPTDNPSARNALLNIQFIWLLLISVGVLVMFFTFYWFLYQWEREVNKKYKNIFVLQGTLSFLMMGFLTTFCVNLWQYAFTLYHDPLMKFLETFVTAAIWFSLGIFSYLFSKYFAKINHIIYDVLDSGLWAIFAVGATFVILLFQGRPTSIRTELISLLIIWSLIFGAARWRRYYYARKSRGQTSLQSGINPALEPKTDPQETADK